MRTTITAAEGKGVKLVSSTHLDWSDLGGGRSDLLAVFLGLGDGLGVGVDLGGGSGGVGLG